MPRETAAREFRTRWRHYVLALLTSVVATASRLGLDPVLGNEYPLVFSFAAIAISAAAGGWGPGLVATIPSFLCADYLFIPPRSELTFLRGGTATIAFSSFCFSSLVIIILAEMARRARQKTLETELRARLELEQKVADRTRELSASNSELEAFSYTVSHDLRSPMRNIEGFISLALEEPSLSTELREYLTRCQRLSRDAQALMDDLLQYSRLKNLEVKLVPVSLESVTQTALERLDKTRRAEAEIKVGQLKAVALGDETHLVQVLQNLLSNALKFTRPGQKPRIEITESIDKDHVRLEIRDHGIGIAPEYQDKIFKVFERLHTSNAYPGSGVGLAIVQRAALKMRGRIGLSSKPNEGATFWIELPSAH